MEKAYLKIGWLAGWDENWLTGDPTQTDGPAPTANGTPTTTSTPEVESSPEMTLMEFKE